MALLDLQLRRADDSIHNVLDGKLQLQGLDAWQVEFYAYVATLRCVDLFDESSNVT